MRNLFNVFVFLAYAICSGSGLIILKIAVSGKEISFGNLIAIIFNIQFLIGFFLYVCGFFIWIYILSIFKLNIAFPIAMSLFFIISSLGSLFILREPFSIQQIAGTVLCFLGIVLIGLK